MIPIAVLLVAWAGCKSQNGDAEPKKEKASPKEAAEDKKEEDDDALPGIPPTRILLSTSDLTPALDRPADLSKDLRGLAEAAAQAGGFTLGSDGHQAEAQFEYGIVVDGRSDPRADRGRIAWKVTIGVKVRGKNGLGELFQATAGDQRPFVRGAVKDVAKAFRMLMRESAEYAFLDVAMQIKYREAKADVALLGLSADRPHEQWAAMRRLGEVGHKAAVPQLIERLEDADQTTLAVVVGVLARLGDPTAIEALAKVAEGADEGRVLLAVDAMGAIGGPKAKKYLELIAASHPTEAIREAVKEILERAEGE
jgi:hypothetical protein